jgi:hypothetical protein
MNCESHDHTALMPGVSLGSCGKPCDQTCDEPCADKSALPTKSRWVNALNNSLFNTLDLCFDDIYREPRKILIVGGCRQMDLSQHIALLLPAAEIHLVDPDVSVVQRAKEEICCRFKFVDTPLEDLPYETNQFDLTIAHNFMALPYQNWERAIFELARVTEANLFFSVHRPFLWKLASCLSGFSKAVQALGLQVPESMPPTFDLINHLTHYAKIKTKLSPLPWTVYMTEVRPKWEEKLTLAS